MQSYCVHSCRSYDKPFYYGTVLPALLLYAFNWIVFIVILLSFIHKHVQMSGKGADSAHTSSKKKLKTYFTLIVALSFFFGLGWGFGLAATSSDIPELTFTFQLLFCIFVGSQGILVFILHCVRPQRMRKKWKSWCNKLTKCTGLSRLTKLHPKSPVGSSKNNGFSAHYNNYHKRVKHHDNVAITTPPLATAMENHSNVIKNMDATVYSNGQSSSGLYELTQSAPYCIQTSDSSSKGFDNPSYMSISPPNSSLRTQTLPQVSSVTLTHTNRGNKRNVCTLESFPNTEIIDLDD